MSADKLISLTFDDGPNLTTTKDMLDLLEQYGVVGSFFVIGSRVNDETAVMMKRALGMGCDIHNHSFTHSFMDKLTAEQIRDEIAKTTELIVKYTGTKPKFFRPPYIAVNDTMRENIGFPFICGIGCEDWVPEVSAEARAERMLREPKDGDIFLLHDMQGNVNTVEALKVVIPELLSRGFKFVTITELFRAKGITPQLGNSGIVYSNCFQTK